VGWEEEEEEEEEEGQFSGREPSASQTLTDKFITENYSNIAKKNTQNIHMLLQYGFL